MRLQGHMLRYLVTVLGLNEIKEAAEYFALRFINYLVSGINLDIGTKYLNKNSRELNRLVRDALLATITELLPLVWPLTRGTSLQC